MLVVVLLLPLLCQCTTVSSTTVVAVAVVAVVAAVVAVAAVEDNIGLSGRQRERRRSHDGMQ